MIRVLFIAAYILLHSALAAQSISAALQKAIKTFESDPQMQHALASLYVVDAATGKVVFAHNNNIGLAPASTQKLITAATAYALLGRDFRYQTQFGLEQNASGYNLSIYPSGDPTLGSWRWPATKEEAVLQRLKNAVAKSGVKNLQSVFIYNAGWTEEGIGDGWIWEDVGNYYGAGAYGLNWRENQFDLLLRSGPKVGDAAIITGTVPKLYDYTVQSQVRAAEKGTGDRTIVYLPVLSKEGTIRGTIPAGEQRFEVSAAFPAPQHQAAQTIRNYLQPADKLFGGEPAIVVEDDPVSSNIIHTETSPPLDSIVYWLNQKSVNLYAEALLKTIAQKRNKAISTDAAAEEVKAFWKGQGIEPTALNIQDGSGLSPQNRVTTNAQVAVLLYAKKQSWYSGFYASLPLYNGMKMKSGTIGGVKGFCGYHTSKDGTTYAFSFLVNNYNGASSAITQKMYAVLNLLK